MLFILPPPLQEGHLLRPPLPALRGLDTPGFLKTSPSHKPWVELLSVAEAGAGLVWQN